MSQPGSITLDWLRGTKILLAAHYVPGPTAAYLLRVMGARVIKVEPPFGDLVRQYPPWLQNDEGQRQSAYFRALNAGFESISINFRHPEGIKILEGLIGQSEVLLDGNRPGYLEKMLGKALSEIHPGLIYAAISAHGFQGPQAALAGHDNNVLAQAGVLSYNNPARDEVPGVAGPQIADMMAGFSAALGILGGLFARQNPQSQAQVPPLDASLLHTAFFLNQLHLGGMNATHIPPTPDREWMNGAAPNYSMYRTRDGAAVFLGSLEPNLFQNFCRAVQRPDWMKTLQVDPASLKSQLQTLFAAHDLSYWETLLQGVDCCFSKVNNLQEALLDPQLAALGLTEKVTDPHFGDLSLTPFPLGLGVPSRPPKVPESAPTPGQHTRAILEEFFQLSPAAIQKLKETGAVS
ncbi:MAG: CoA transferase [Bacteroidia bacterium]|nr:CoA transferase [Bacteroidia bacterium]